MKNKAISYLLVAVTLTVMLCIVILLSCDGFFPSQVKVDVPADHTVDVSGALHKTGLFDPSNPVQGCTDAACHGDDLKGGVAVSGGRHVAVPSCYQCHGAIWEGGEDSEGEGHDD